MTAPTASAAPAFTPAAPAAAASVPHRDRYTGAARAVAAVLIGILAGMLLVGSAQVGIAFAVEGRNPREWSITQWGNHWVWRAIAGAVTTYAAGFLAGMVARRRGSRVGAISAVPSALFWAFIAYVGWAGPVTWGRLELPLGYKIIATFLALALVPLGSAGGQAGAPFGRANAKHFDHRRAAFLGVRWYHFLWLPFLIHSMVMVASFGGAYGSQWVVRAWKAAMSLFSIVPMIFTVALLSTLNLLGQGAMGAYEALAGFDADAPTPAWKRVLKFGFGYTLAVAAAQAAIVALHYGLAKLFA